MTDQKKQKFYYVQHCNYGVNVSPLSLNGHAYSYYAFTSYQAREDWLNEHEWDNCNLVYASITRKGLEERIGKRFVIAKDYGLYDSDDNQVAYEVLEARDIDAACCVSVYRSF